MPVISDIPLKLTVQEVRRRQGLWGKANVHPKIKILIEELLDSVESQPLLEPMVAYENYPIAGMKGNKISLGGGKTVYGPALPAFFPEAKELVILIGTIGPKLEEHVSGYAKSGQPLRSLLLDGIGSAAVDKLISEAQKFILAEASLRGYEMSSSVNPGMPGFPITEQWNLLELSKAHKIGVSLTTLGILIPRKSTSMVIGIGYKMTRWTQTEVCARCNLKETCSYKITMQEKNDL
jgi:hypothetical protein